MELLCLVVCLNSCLGWIDLLYELLPHRIRLLGGSLKAFLFLVTHRVQDVSHTLSGFFLVDFNYVHSIIKGLVNEGNKDVWDGS